MCVGCYAKNWSPPMPRAKQYFPWYGYLWSMKRHRDGLKYKTLLGLIAWCPICRQYHSCKTDEVKA